MYFLWVFLHCFRQRVLFAWNNIISCRTENFLSMNDVAYRESCSLHKLSVQLHPTARRIQSVLYLAWNCKIHERMNSTWHSLGNICTSMYVCWHLKKKKKFVMNSEIRDEFRVPNATFVVSICTATKRHRPSSNRTPLDLYVEYRSIRIGETQSRYEWKLLRITFYYLRRKVMCK